MSCELELECHGGAAERAVSYLFSSSPAKNEDILKPMSSE